MTTIYEDDVVVGELTRLAFEKTDSRLLQIHRFADGDVAHAAALLKIFSPPHGSRIADVGCGVGVLADLMHKMRPDLFFVLINKSREQLEMCPRFSRYVGTAENLPVPDDSGLDAIMVTYALGHFDLDAFINECVRVKVTRVYVYDLFKRDPACDDRLESDLQYTARTVNEVIKTFWEKDFIVAEQAITAWVPDDIKSIMPSPETLNNTVSAALVFER
jgi:ubiquinone/menaquinone biosynthesis C-methylase UbiE